MDFVSVVRELKEGNVYKRSEWEESRYLVVDEHDQLKEYYYGDLKDFEPTTEAILDSTWEKCEKDTWIINHKNYETSSFSERLYITYSLSHQSGEDHIYWDKDLNERDLNQWKNYVSFIIGEHCGNEEEMKHLLAK